MKIVNGENAVMGRLASYVAKEAMKGEEFAVVNCEKVIITGDKKAFIGIASKDLSQIILDGIDISNVKYAFAVYQKKTEYGPAIIYSLETQISDVENKYIVEENSELKINKRIVLEDKINVYEMLYGK